MSVLYLAVPQICLFLQLNVSATDLGIPLSPASNHPPTCFLVTTLGTIFQPPSASGTSQYHFFSLAPFCQINRKLPN